MASHREATRLDNLPMEILRRIAAAGPAANVLPAMKTCRSLYGAYFDTLVLKEILENENVCPARFDRNPGMLCLH